MAKDGEQRYWFYDEANNDFMRGKNVTAWHTYLHEEVPFLEANSLLSNKLLPMKDLFGSASDYPCLPLYSHFHPDFAEDMTTSFFLIEPERDCRRFYDYFNKTGMPSFIDPILQFEIPAETIIKSVGVHKKLKETLG